MEEKKPDFRKQAIDFMWEKDLDYAAFRRFSDYEDCVKALEYLFEDCQSELSSLKEEVDRLKSQIQELRNS